MLRLKSNGSVELPQEAFFTVLMIRELCKRFHKRNWGTTGRAFFLYGLVVSSTFYSAIVPLSRGCKVSESNHKPKNTWTKPHVGKGKVSMDNFLVVGYQTSWAGNVSDIQFDKLTHINYAFLLPDNSGDGSLQPLPKPEKLKELVSAAHRHGIKAMVSVGGWNDGNDQGFEKLAASETATAAFISNLQKTVEEFGLDGVDIDWEYPDPGSSSENYARLMDRLGKAMHDRGKLLTAAVVALGPTGGGVPKAVFDDVDFLTLMAYDKNDRDHSPYGYAEESLSYWLGRGLPKSKAILGLPFYGRPTWNSYRSLMENDPEASQKDRIEFNGKTVYYNGIPTIRKKTRLALQKGGGVIMWDLSQDSRDETSLLNALHDEIAVTRRETGRKK